MENLTYRPDGAATHNLPKTAEFEHKPTIVEKLAQGMLENHAGIKPIRQDHASCPIEQAYDWPDIFARVNRFRQELVGASDLSAEVYVFDFNSVPNPTASDDDREVLIVADIRATVEAVESKPNDLFYYHAGDPDENGNVRSFCIWSNAHTAREVIHGSAHVEAAKLAPNAYIKAITKGYTVSRTEAGQVEFSKELFIHDLLKKC